MDSRSKREVANRFKDVAGPSSRRIALERTIESFAMALKADPVFKRWLTRSPRAFKKEATRLLAAHLPRRPGGRPRAARITRAAALFVEQRREVRNRTRKSVNWYQIATAADPNFQNIRSLFHRRAEIMVLRSSVYRRLERQQKHRRPSPVSGEKHKPTNALVPPK